MNEMIYALNAEQSLKTLREDFLNAISQLIFYDRGFIDLGCKKNNKVEFFDPVGWNMEQKYLDAYFDEYESIDTMFWFFSQEHDNTYRETDYINKTMRNASVFYSEWLLPQNIYYSMGSKIIHDGILYGSVNLWRKKEQGDFSDEDMQIMEILNKHLSLRFYSQFPNGIRKNNENEYSDTLAHLYHLTPREIEIISELYNGHSVKEVADILYISENTVKKHSHNIFQKMKIEHRAQLIKIVHDHITDLVDSK